MSGTLNKVLLIGNLGDNVKIHYFENGGCIARFPIATTESYVNKEGERIKNTEWHNIVVRNKGAEICEKYIKKGDKIYIEGRIRTRQWKDEAENIRYRTEIIAIDFTFLTPKGSNDLSQSPSSLSENEKLNSSDNLNTDKDQDGDLPF